MTQFNFTTNIEKRMPNTGKVFCIDRMTSDYAEQHPLDVDGFIESVYQEFAGTEFEECRETLRSIWTAVLSVKSPCGDASLYPNNNGRKRAAAMKVWMKAGDYWRRGFHQGDILPDLVPMTKITRLDDGAWIALFPKDKYLLEDGEKDAPIVMTESRNEETVPEPEPKQTEPRQLDLFAFEQLQQENEALQARIDEMERQAQQRRASKCAERFPREDQSRRQHSQAVAVAVEPVNNRAWLQTAGYLAAASVALLIIWQTGLIIPLGLIGLATSGFLK